MVMHQDAYITEAHLKYIGGMLSDPEDDVRLKVLEVLRAVLDEVFPYSHMGLVMTTNRLLEFCQHYKDSSTVSWIV